MDTNAASARPSWETERKRNKKMGVLFCAGPFLGIVVTMIVWSIVSAIASSIVSTGGMHATTLPWARWLNVALGIIGMLFVIMIPVGAIIGIVYLSRGPSGPPTSEPPSQPPQSP